MTEQVARIDGLVYMANEVRLGAQFPPLILVAKDVDAYLVVMEGHVRLTAYLIAPEYLPSELEVILGSSERLTDWGVLLILTLSMFPRLAASFNEKGCCSSLRKQRQLPHDIYHAEITRNFTSHRSSNAAILSLSQTRSLLYLLKGRDLSRMAAGSGSPSQAGASLEKDAPMGGPSPMA